MPRAQKTAFSTNHKGQMLCHFGRSKLDWYSVSPSQNILWTLNILNHVDQWLYILLFPSKLFFTSHNFQSKQTTTQTQPNPTQLTNQPTKKNPQTTKKQQQNEQLTMSQV